MAVFGHASDSFPATGEWSAVRQLQTSGEQVAGKPHASSDEQSAVSTQQIAAKRARKHASTQVVAKLRRECTARAQRATQPATYNPFGPGGRCGSCAAAYPDRTIFLGMNHASCSFRFQGI